MNALRQSHLDLQARILELREKEILPLREHVSTLNRNWWRFSVVSGIVVLLLTILGVRTYNDLQQLIKDSFKQQLEKSFGYYDKLMRARVLTSDGKHKLAELYYRDLLEAKPDDETIFINLTDCLIQQHDPEAASQVVESAEKAGIFPRKFQQLLSFNNAGWAFLARDIDQPSKLDKAHRYLKRAEDMGVRDNDPELSYALGNLSVYYFAIGDFDKARAYATRWRQMDKSAWTEPIDELWYQKLLKSNPAAIAEMKKLFAVDTGSTSSPSPSQSIGLRTTAP